jgi:P27 family predicted phage terminase small subunit
LDHEARKEWYRVIKRLRPLGLATSLDRAALTAYCVAWQRWLAAEETLRREGPVITSRLGTPMVSPHFQVAQSSMAQMRAMLQEFGMSPAARARVTATQATDDDGDEITQFRRAHPRP